jgi:hypothetical protein
MDDSDKMEVADPMDDLVESFGKMAIVHFPFIAVEFFIDERGRVVRRSPRLGGVRGSYFKPSDDGRMLPRSARIHWPVLV